MKKILIGLLLVCSVAQGASERKVLILKSEIKNYISTMTTQRNIFASIRDSGKLDRVETKNFSNMVISLDKQIITATKIMDVDYKSSEYSDDAVIRMYRTTIDVNSKLKNSISNVLEIVEY